MSSRLRCAVDARPVNYRVGPEKNHRNLRQGVELFVSIVIIGSRSSGEGASSFPQNIASVHTLCTLPYLLDIGLGLYLHGERRSLANDRVEYGV